MDVREALLTAAVKLFGEVGSRGATTRRIAQEAGVNEVTLFRHFGKKEELMGEALRWFAEHATLARLPEVPVHPTTELADWCRDYHRLLCRIRAPVRTLMAEYVERPEQCAHAMRLSIGIANELSDYLSQLKTRGLAHGDWDPHAASAMLMGTIFGDAMGRDIVPERYPYAMRHATEKYLHLFLRAIGLDSERE
jgi:AcrR family transcriptional regulator